MSKPIPERRNRPHRHVNALLHGRRCLLWQQAERRADAYVPINGKLIYGATSGRESLPDIKYAPIGSGGSNKIHGALEFNSRH